MRNAIFTAVVAMILFSSTAFAEEVKPTFCQLSSAQSPKHWQAYTKIGWFSWKEQLRGAQFIKDEGMLYAVGIQRTDRIWKQIGLTELVEVWGGNPTYDGQRTFTGEPMHQMNGYIGTREEIRTDVAIPIGNLTISPFIGIGHKFWARFAEGELWHMGYSPLGARISYRFNRNVLAFAEGGVIIPLWTTNTMFMGSRSIGYEDVHLKPRARAGQFAELGATISAFSVSLAFEATNFDKSDMVTTRSLDGTRTAAFCQPDSKTSTSWLRVGYNF